MASGEYREATDLDPKEIEKKQLQLEVKQVMGVVRYHLMPWKREKYTKKVIKLRKIEAELMAREEFENEED